MTRHIIHRRQLTKTLTKLLTTWNWILMLELPHLFRWKWKILGHFVSVKRGNGSGSIFWPIDSRRHVAAHNQLCLDGQQITMCKARNSFWWKTNLLLLQPNSQDFYLISKCWSGQVTNALLPPNIKTRADDRHSFPLSRDPHRQFLG